MPPKKDEAPESADSALTLFMSKNPVTALLIMGLLSFGGGSGLMALRAPEDAAAKIAALDARVAKIEAKQEEQEKRLTVVEAWGGKIAEMQSDIRVIRVLMERSDSKAKAR